MRLVTTAIAFAIVMLSVLTISTTTTSATTTNVNVMQPQPQYEILMNNTTNPTTGQVVLIITWITLMIAFAIIGISRMKWSVISGFIWISGGVMIFTPMQSVLGMIIITVGFMFCMVGAFGFVKRR